MPKRHERVHCLRNVPGIAVDRMGAAADDIAERYPDLLRLENLDTDLRHRQWLWRQHVWQSSEIRTTVICRMSGKTNSAGLQLRTSAACREFPTTHSASASLQPPD